MLWTRHLILLGQFKRPEKREFYVRLAIRERWSRWKVGVSSGLLALSCTHGLKRGQRRGGPKIGDVPESGRARIAVWVCYGIVVSRPCHIFC